MLGSVPQLSFALIYVLTNLAEWSYLELSINNLVLGLGYFIFLLLLLNKVRKVKLDTLYIAGTFGFGLFCISNFSMFFARQIPFPWMFAVQIMVNFLSSMSQDLPTIAIIGRFSEHCPKGLETTGITLLISLTNLGVSAGGIISDQEVTYFHAVEGYYDNLRYPLIINTGIAILLLFILPLFL